MLSTQKRATNNEGKFIYMIEKQSLPGKKIMKKCFIITPVGLDGSEIRTEANGIIEAVIKPTLQSDYEIIAAHLSSASVQITKEIIQCIYHSDLIIANLSGSNPNVLYELSLAHALRKPVVHIIREGEKPPFDISVQRYISYTNNMIGVVHLRTQLTLFVEAAIKEGRNVSNPITDAIDNISIVTSERELTLEGGFALLNNRLSSIEKTLYQNTIYRDKVEYDSTIISDRKYHEFLEFFANSRESIESLGDDASSLEQLSDIIDVSIPRLRRFINYYINTKRHT